MVAVWIGSANPSPGVPRPDRQEIVGDLPAHEPLQPPQPPTLRAARVGRVKVSPRQSLGKTQSRPPASRRDHILSRPVPKWLREHGWQLLGGLGALAAILGVVVPLVIVPLVKDIRNLDQPVQVILAMDVSTSMKCPVRDDILKDCPDARGKVPRFAGPARIDAAVNGGAVPALSYFKSGDRLGIWSFGSRIDQGTIYPFESEAETAATDRLRSLAKKVGGGTLLYQTIYEAVLRLRKDFKGDAVNALVILTDGRDNGSMLADGTRLDEQVLNDELGKDPDEPVHVLFTAAYEDDVRCDELLDDIDDEVFNHKCFQVTDGSDVQTAFNAIQEHLDELANR